MVGLKVLNFRFFHYEKYNNDSGWEVGGTNGTASVHIPLGKIIVEDNRDKNTYMNGFLIANTVEIRDKNVYCNSYGCSGNHAPLNAFVDSQEGSITAAGNLEVIAFQDPSMSTFSLRIKTESSKEIQIRIYGMLSRIVNELKGQPDQTLRLGEDFVFGTYITEVKQGDGRVMVLLIRQ